MRCYIEIHAHVASEQARSVFAGFVDRVSKEMTSNVILLQDPWYLERTMDPIRVVLHTPGDTRGGVADLLVKPGGRRISDLISAAFESFGETSYAENQKSSPVSIIVADSQLEEIITLREKTFGIALNSTGTASFESHDIPYVDVYDNNKYLRAPAGVLEILMQYWDWFIECCIGDTFDFAEAIDRVFGESTEP